MRRLPLALALVAAVLDALTARVPVADVRAGTEAQFRAGTTAIELLWLIPLALLSVRLSRLALPGAGRPSAPIATIGVTALAGLGLFVLKDLLIAIAAVGEVSYHALRVLAVSAGHDPAYSLSGLAAAEAAAIYEELAFRGVLLSGTMLLASRVGVRRSSALGAAVLVSSLAFGAFHLGTPVNMAMHAVSGLGFGLLFCWRGLLPAWVAHASVNASAYAFANYVAPLIL